MISQGRDIRIFTGNSNPALARAICARLGIPLGSAEVKTFADGEVAVTLNETVRGYDVFLIGSTCEPVNDNLMELLIMADACKRASAGRINTVIPYFGYARQDRKAKPRDPISAKLVADMLTTAGNDRILTIDLHAAQIQGFFDIPVDNLFGRPIFVDYYQKKFGESCRGKVVVSPDVGSVARARSFAKSMDMQLAIVDRRHGALDGTEEASVIGDVRGKDCIIFDDMIDTGDNTCRAAEALVERGGACRIFAAATHGIFSGKAIDYINDSVLEEVAVLDTIPDIHSARCPKLKYLTVAPVLSEAIEYIHMESSITKLF